MTTKSVREPDGQRPPWLRILTRKDVLAGLMFMAIAVLGLVMSRNYPIGTALRMSTGYVPRLLCWILLALGGIVLVQGLRTAEREVGADPETRNRPIVIIPLAFIAFALTLERLGLVIAGLLLIGIGSLAGRGMRAVEVAVVALALVALTWGVFVFALGLPINVWPDL
jgi:hypothetical protein